MSPKLKEPGEATVAPPKENFAVINARMAAADAIINSRPNAPQALADLRRAHQEHAKTPGVKPKTDREILREVVREIAKVGGTSELTAIQKFGDALNKAASAAGFTQPLSLSPTEMAPLWTYDLLVSYQQAWQAMQNREKEAIYAKIEEERKAKEMAGKSTEAKAEAAVKLNEFENKLKKDNDEFKRILEDASKVAGTTAASAPAGAAAEQKGPAGDMRLAPKMAKETPLAEYAAPPDFSGGMGVRVDKGVKAQPVKPEEVRAEALRKVQRYTTPKFAEQIVKKMDTVIKKEDSAPENFNSLRMYILESVKLAIEKATGGAAKLK
jgi:hypothetical protein